MVLTSCYGCARWLSLTALKFIRTSLGKPVVRGTRIPVELLLRKLREVLPKRISWMPIRG